MEQVVKQSAGMEGISGKVMDTIGGGGGLHSDVEEEEV